MSTDYRLVCFTCEEEAPEAFASGSIAYGYKVWGSKSNLEWLGDRKPCGHHENHDLRIVNEGADLPWEAEGVK